MKKASIALLPAMAMLVLAGPARASLSATTGAATVTDTTALLNGAVDSSGTPTYYFEYGTTEAYGAQSAPVPFDKETKVQWLATGLSPATLYHFRIVAARPDRAVRGADATFVTAPALTGPVIADPLGGGNPGAAAPSGGGDQQGGDQQSGDQQSGDQQSGDQQGADNQNSDSQGTSVTPAIGETIGASPATGTVSVEPPGEDGFAPLPAGAPIPDGTTVDARNGSVTIVTAVGDAGETQTATFHGAKFQVSQNRAAGGLTDIYLRGGNFAACGRSTRGQVSAVTGARAKKRRPVRSLWGHDHGGRFRTHGRGALATVRGTTWIVADHCDGTRTSVLSGAVSVWDKRLRRSTLVQAGHSYFARTAPPR